MASVVMLASIAYLAMFRKYFSAWKVAKLSAMCDALRMSEELRTTSGVPIKWDRADRMRKALRVAGMTPGEMADYLGVGGNTVSTWINGRIDPSYTTVRLWAFVTGVPLEWLHHGDMEPCDLTQVDIPAGQGRSGTSAKLMQTLQTCDVA
jgi:DNA-binding transcriptional regulator YiaG